MSTVRTAITAIRAAKDEPPPEPPRQPELLTPEHVVGADELPNGPRRVANVVDHDAWQTTWLKAVTERLEGPKRGGTSYGLRFDERDGLRYGWAVWVEGKYLGGFVYPWPRAGVPTQLKVVDLKALLAHSEGPPTG